MLAEEYIIAVYCLVDEMLKKVVKSKLIQRGPQPKLTDAEVITMEIAQLIYDKQQIFGL